MCHSQLLHYNENQGKSHKINNYKSKKDMVSVCENSFLNPSLCRYGRIFPIAERSKWSDLDCGR